MSRLCKRCEHENADEAKFCLKCGNMLELEAEETGDPLVGKILLQRYRVLEMLGEGGMGKVYLAEQKMGTATRKVAIKTLHPEMGNDPQLVARFHRECETVIEMSHPNTVQFYDFGDLEDGTLFIVMEHIEGESLASVLQRGAIDPGRADKILIQVCGSLHEAHQRGVVHRDLKPENVLLTERGGQTDFVKVLDFGIAKRNEAEDDSKQKLTKQGMVLGTPPYMSPEQFSGQALDWRSDIYSLGTMAYEMVTGQLPFQANTPWEWATKHLTTQPTPLEAHPASAQLPENKRYAVLRALAKNRDERHATVLDFMHEFTGMQDAQAAWTMATTPSAGRMAAAQPAGPEARAPVGTPQPMPQTGGAPPGSGQQSAGSHTTPLHGQASGAGPQQAPGYPTPAGGGWSAQGPAAGGAWSSQGSAAMPARSGSGVGKVLAVLVIMMFVVGGAGAGGLWWWLQRDTDGSPIASQDGLNGTETQGPSEGTQSNPMVPSTPPEQVEDGREGPATSDGEGSGGDPSPSGPDETGEPDPEGSDRPGGGDGQSDDEHARDDHPGHGRDRPGHGRDRPGHGRDDRPGHARDDGPDSDDQNNPQGDTGKKQAKARSLLEDARSDLDRNKLRDAVRALKRAQSLVGRSNPKVRDVRSELARRASNKVGILMQQGDCSGAQALYRKLRSVSAHRASAQQFSSDWCPRP